MLGDMIKIIKIILLQFVIEKFGSNAQCHEVLCHLHRVDGFCLTKIVHYAKSCLATESAIFADELRYFRAMGKPGCKRPAIVTDGEHKSVQHLIFKRANSISGNVKNIVPPGTFHALCGQHVPRYLVNFACLFNRRFDFLSIIERLLFIFLRILPMFCYFMRKTEIYEKLCNDKFVVLTN